MTATATRGRAGSTLENVDLDRQLHHVEQRLAREFATSADPVEVTEHVAMALAALGQPRVRHFVPILVERAARRSLTGLASSRASVASGLPG